MAAQLEPEDYENICMYLEELEHYAKLFGTSLKMTVGGGAKVAKAKVWVFFAEFMNETNARLQLNGCRLQQQFGTNKDKY